jgi:hypothetical protein
VAKALCYKPEGMLKPKIWNESLHEVSNNTGVGVINFATSKNQTLKVPYSHIVTFINLLGHLLMERLIIRVTTFL